MARGGLELDKSLTGRVAEVVQRAIDVDAPKRSLGDLASKLGQVMGSVEAAAGGLSLDSVEVGVEITAEGGVALIGTAKAGAKASITLGFSRAR